MLKISKSGLVLLFSIAIILIGCENTDPSYNIKGNIKKNVNDPFNLVPQDLEITATLSIFKSISYNAQLNTFITTKGCDAAFYNGSGYSVKAGDVTLNSSAVRRYSEPTGIQTPDSMYAYGYQPYNSISFNGGNYSWYVSGSALFPNLSVSITSPPHEANITNPSNGSNVSKSSDLSITWSQTLVHSDTVKILMTCDNKVINKYVPDNGSFTVTSNELSVFNTGDKVAIHVAVGNYKFVSVSNKYALVTITSIHQIYCNIVN